MECRLLGLRGVKQIGVVQGVVRVGMDRFIRIGKSIVGDTVGILCQRVVGL